MKKNEQKLRDLWDTPIIRTCRMGIPNERKEEKEQKEHVKK